MKFEKKETPVFSEICLPELFISEYLPLLSSDAIKVYLYILYASKKGIEISPLDISKRIGSTIDFVKNAFLKLEENELIIKTTEGYIINDIREIALNKLYTPKLTSSLEDANENAEKNVNRLKAINMIKNSYFQGVMPPTWYTDIDMMITKFNFSEEVLISLFKYCFDRCALNRNYVKTVANAWYSKKIETLDDLERYYINYEKCSDIKKKICKKLGISRQLTQYEEAYVEKWLTEYNYDFNIIDLALKQTTSKTNPTFNYINKILTDWNEKGLRSPQDIKKYLTDFSNKEKLIKENRKQTKPANMTNYTQREYNEDFSQFYDNLNLGGE